MNLEIRLEVSIDDQVMRVLSGHRTVRQYAISTAAKGMGFREQSYRTPTGTFEIAEKIGAGEPIGTIYRSRVAVGRWQEDADTNSDLILTRILTLRGLDPENGNTLQRNIYIHGTNQEDLLGAPKSHGCIRLGNADMIEIFDLVAEGTELFIMNATKPGGKLLFIDCDSTLSSIEGIDELARAKGPDVYAQVVELTNAAMNGDVPIHEIFSRRMEMIRPDREVCTAVAQQYIQTMVPGIADFIKEVKRQGWLPVILSGGFAPLIQPLAKALGFEHVEAVPLYFHEDGSYAGYGYDYPTTRNLGKNEVIREWKQAMLPECVMMIGDGVSDLETKPDVDLFVGYGGVIAREKVQIGCDHWMTEYKAWDQLEKLMVAKMLDKSLNDTVDKIA